MVVSSYVSDNERIYIGLVDSKTKEPYTDITINLSDPLISFNQGYIDPINYEIGLVGKLMELGIIKETNGVRNYNLGEYSLATFDIDKLREYDKGGVDLFYRDYKKFNTLVDSDMNFKTRSGNYLHFHPNEEGYDFTYYDENKKIIDGGILETNKNLPLKNILRNISELLSRPSLDKSLEDLKQINDLEFINENIEENIKI